MGRAYTYPTAGPLCMCGDLAHTCLGSGSSHLPGRSFQASEVTVSTMKPEVCMRHTPRVGGLLLFRGPNAKCMDRISIHCVPGAKPLQSPGELPCLGVSPSVGISCGKSGGLSADVNSLMQGRWGTCQWKGAHGKVSLSSACPTNHSTQLLPFLGTLGFPAPRINSSAWHTKTFPVTFPTTRPSCGCILMCKPSRLRLFHQYLLSVGQTLGVPR